MEKEVMQEGGEGMSGSSFGEMGGTKLEEVEDYLDRVCRQKEKGEEEVEGVAEDEKEQMFLDFLGDGSRSVKKDYFMVRNLVREGQAEAEAERREISFYEVKGLIQDNMKFDIVE